MKIDPLADRLSQLIETGSLPYSRLTKAMARQVESLFDFDILGVARYGGGRRIVVRDSRALRRWVHSRYPSSLEGTRALLPPRAEAVANFADSKAGRPLAHRAVFMRGFRGSKLFGQSGIVPLDEMTNKHGLAGVLLDLRTPWKFKGTLALVENLELFLHIEQVVPHIDAALWTVGRLEHALLEWIAGMADCHVLHVGDFDPVGLDEYLRLVAAQPQGGATLFVPHDLERRLSTYGKEALLLDSAAVLDRVRRTAPEDVRPVLTIIDKYCKGLEQEALLIPLP